MGCSNHKIWSQSIKWKGGDLRRLDKSSKKILAMNDELHPKGDVVILYVPRKLSKVRKTILHDI